MKLFILIAVLFVGTIMYGQEIDCTRSASLAGANGYKHTGDAFLERFDDGTLQLRMGNNFSVSSGPDLFVFLTNNPNSTNGGVELFKLSDVLGEDTFDGAFTFQISSDINIEDYSHVVTFCRSFRRLWGAGEFSEFTCTASGGSDGPDEEPDTEPEGAVECLESATATTNWITEITVCTDDGIADPIELKTTLNEVTLGQNFSFLLTDANQNLQQVISEAEFDFDDTGLETQLVFGIQYRGDLNFTIGRPITKITGDTCFQLSSMDNFLTVNKESCVETFQCLQTTISSSTGTRELMVCPSDGAADLVAFTNNQDESPGDNFSYVITDDSNIIQDVISDSSFNFEGSGDGVQRVYGAHFDGDLMYTIGENISEITASGCVELSSDEAFLTILKGNCTVPPSTRIVSGTIVNPQGEGLANVRIDVAGRSATSDSQGRFSITQLPTDVSLSIAPSNDSNSANGVSSLDIILVTRHILGL